MAKQPKWRFYLFLLGAFISCLIGVLEVVLTLKGAFSDLSWPVVALLAFGALLPAVLFGLPYLNSRFMVSYSKESGLTIAEEKKIKKECECKINQ
jgi:hypothetical protein